MSQFMDLVPKTLKENLEFRLKVLRRCAKDKKFREAMWEACRLDILFYFNVFCWTYDPRPSPPEVNPFITYPYQDAVILAIRNGYKTQTPLCIQKVRDVGGSWCMLACYVHESIFVRRCKFLLLSRNAELVDKPKDFDSLFAKIDHLNEHFPEWLTGCSPGELPFRSSMTCQYPNRSTITGATTTKSSGVGGRATGVGVDEWSMFDPEIAARIKSGTQPVSNAQIFLFTPDPSMGKSHPSQALVKQVKDGKFPGITMDWKDHPLKNRGLYQVHRKTGQITVHDKTYSFPSDYKFQTDGRFEWHSPWFDKERDWYCNDHFTAVNCQLDDDEGGSFMVFDSQRIRAYIADHCRPPDIEGDLIYDEQAGKPVRFERRDGGDIKLWMQLGSHDLPPMAEYVAGVDCALGRGATNSVFSAGRWDTGEKVLELAVCTPAQKAEPKEFAIKCVAICRWLSKGFADLTKLCWERQGPGDTFGVEVVKLGYHNSYTAPAHGFHEASKMPGWNPQRMSSLLDQYRSGLGQGHFTNRSQLALEECLEWVVVPDGGYKHKAHQNRKIDPSGASKNHGDRVVADAICYMLMQEKGVGGPAEKENQTVTWGSFEWLMQEEAAKQASKKTLYPNWRK